MSDLQHTRETSPKRCAECGGKFGLTRQYSCRSSLCSKKCLELFKAKRVRVRQWLFGANPEMSR